MSWAEVKKVNSDFVNEPLNFQNYINDIAVFGGKSYVMDVQNASLWEDLIVNSLTLYGHSAIHEYVLERMTDDDVYLVVTSNSRLGQSLNSFYRTDVFKVGNIDDVLSEINSDSLNMLDEKFQKAVNRYISEKMNGENVGEYLAHVFPSIDGLSKYSTATDLLKDTDFVSSVVVNNPSVSLLVLTSDAAVDYFTNSTELGEYFNQAVAVIAQSYDSTYKFLSNLNDEKMNALFVNESAAKKIYSNASSVKAIFYNSKAFKSVINNADSIKVFLESQVAIDELLDAFVNVASSENNLSILKSNIDSINSVIESLDNTKELVRETDEIYPSVLSYLDSLEKVANLVNTLIDNVANIDTNEKLHEAIKISDTISSTIANKINAMDTGWEKLPKQSYQRNNSSTYTIYHGSVYRFYYYTPSSLKSNQGLIKYNANSDKEFIGRPSDYRYGNVIITTFRDKIYMFGLSDSSSGLGNANYTWDEENGFNKIESILTTESSYRYMGGSARIISTNDAVYIYGTFYQNSSSNSSSGNFLFRYSPEEGFYRYDNREFSIDNSYISLCNVNDNVILINLSKRKIYKITNDTIAPLHEFDEIGFPNVTQFTSNPVVIGKYLHLYYPYSSTSLKYHYIFDGEKTIQAEPAKDLYSSSYAYVYNPSEKKLYCFSATSGTEDNTMDVYRKDVSYWNFYNIESVFNKLTNP